MRWLRLKIAGWVIRAGVGMLPVGMRTLYGFMSEIGLAWLKNDDLVKKTLSGNDFSFVIEVTNPSTTVHKAGD